MLFLKVELTPAQTFVKDAFTLPTLLGIGALTQALVFTLLPARYSLLPAALLIGRAAISTILEVRDLKSNPLIEGAIPGRVTAQLPLPLRSKQGASASASAGFSSGIPPQPSFGNVPASSPLVVFHLGIHFNHPLGLLSPGAREIGASFEAMTASLAARRDDYGMISSSVWRGTERASHNAILFIAYFRSAADLNRFAHDKVHRDGWDWYHKFVRETGHRHFGLFHETFVTRRGEWETIYMDSPPTLLGNGNVKVGAGPGGEEEVVGEEKGLLQGGEEAWIRPVVSADHPALRSQAKRMGMTLGMEEDLERNEI